jgi:hypothetical protein
MREMLDKRHREPKLHSNQQQTSTNSEKSKLERVDYFETQFEKKICEIENHLNDLKPTGDVQ